MTPSTITSAIRAAQGEVMAFGPTSFGFIIRATIGGQSCRIISPKTSQKTQITPLRRGCETHIVINEQGLQFWLNSLSPSSPLKAL